MYKLTGKEQKWMEEETLKAKKECWEMYRCELG